VQVVELHIHSCVSLLPMPSAMFISSNVNMQRSASTGVSHLINY